jgi:hypothetical protein
MPKTSSVFGVLEACNGSYKFRIAMAHEIYVEEETGEVTVL